MNTVVVRCGKRYTLPPGSSLGDDLGVRYDYQPGLYDDVRLILTGGATVENIRSAPDLEKGTLRVVAAIRNVSGTRRVPNTIPVTFELREVKTGKLAGRRKPRSNSAQRRRRARKPRSRWPIAFPGRPRRRFSINSR